MDKIQIFGLCVAFLIVCLFGAEAHAAEKPADADNFYTSDKTTMEKVVFPNQYRMNIAGNLYTPKDATRPISCPPSSSGIPWARSKSRARIFTQQKWLNTGL